MKILNITHSNCTDGLLASHALYKNLMHGVKYDIVFMQYGDIFPIDVIDEYDYVIITNFSFNRYQAATITEWMSNGIKVIVIDRHESAKWIMNEEWCQKDLLDKFAMVYSETMSVALITYLIFSRIDVESTCAVFGNYEVINGVLLRCTSSSMNYDYKLTLYNTASDYDLFTKSSLDSSYLNEYIQHLVQRLNTDFDIYKLFDAISNNCIMYDHGFILGKAIYDTKQLMIK